MSKYIFRNEKGGYESAYDKNSLMKLCYEEIADLEAKLAEKEKELGICRNQAIVDMQYKEFLELKLATIENVKNRVNCNVADNQDKISFAVEQLSQFKNELVNNVSPVNLSYTEYVQEVFNKLNNQIKQLKEGK